MSAVSGAALPRYADAPRTDYSAVPRSHPLWHVGRKLRATIERLLGELGLEPGERVLDLGCAAMPYRGLLAPGVEHVGADLPGNPVATLELRPDGRVPAADETFDAVLSTQVLEHVIDPGLHLAESRRLLRAGGRMLLSTHGLMAYHPDPVDLWRWTGAGLRRQVEEAGFAIERFEGVIGQVATGLQLVQDGLLGRIPVPLRAPAAACFQSLVALADRLGSAPAERENAMVFALVASRR